MPEYFDLSALIKKDDRTSDEIVQSFKMALGKEGNSIANSKILMTISENEGEDFIELCLSFPNQVFHKENSEEELRIFHRYAHKIFEKDVQVKYIVCSYELNGYLLGSIKSLNDIDERFLDKFPIAYKKKKDTNEVKTLLNLEAQDIFY